MLRHPEAKEKKGLIDMNCRTFQDALQDVFSRGWDQDKDQEIQDQENQGSQRITQGQQAQQA